MNIGMYKEIDDKELAHMIMEADPVSRSAVGKLETQEHQ